MDRIFGIASALAFCLTTTAQVSVACAQSAEALGAPVASPEAPPAVEVPTTQAVEVPPTQAVPTTQVEVPPTPTVQLVPPPPGSYGASLVPRVDVRPLQRQRSGYMPSWQLLAPGLAAFISTYGAAVYTAAQLDLAGFSGEIIDWLYIPVVGPFMIAGESNDDFATAAFVALGIVQAAGLGLIVAGLAINRNADHDGDVVTLHVAPMLGSGQAGLMAVGRF